MKKIKDIILFKGKKAKSGPVHTRDIVIDDLRYIFFPKDHNEKYGYLGYVYVNEFNYNGEPSIYFEPLMEIITTMDRKAKPWWCPRWFLRFLDVFGNDKSIVRVRNFRLHELFNKITKGYKIWDWKTKWSMYDLRISVSGDKEIQDLVDRIEMEFRKKEELLGDEI